MAIGRRKYEALKSFGLDDITEKRLEEFHNQFKGLRLADAIKMIIDYEKIHLPNKKTIKYLNEIKTPNEKKEPQMIDKEWLWKRFLVAYYQNEGVRFSTKFNGEEDHDVIENLKPLIYYFIGDFDNFKKCKQVSDLSEPSMNKGLLIIGDTGNGKTSIMNAFETALRVTNVRFLSYSTNEVVSMYESCEKPIQKEEFNDLMTTGTRFFDDVLTERLASNYGKANIIKDILEERSLKKKRTYITCNYVDGDDTLNLKNGLLQFYDKYGKRLYDRIFSDFNIIEFKGKSRRR